MFVSSNVPLLTLGKTRQEIIKVFYNDVATVKICQK